jgi:hypothetical protein
VGALLAVGLVGLLIGIWFGLPGRYTQTPDEIEKLMERGGGTRRRRPKRAISPLAWLQRKLSASGPPQRTGRKPRGFRLETPEERRKRDAGE